MLCEALVLAVSLKFKLVSSCTNIKFAWVPYTRFHCQVCKQKLETGEYSEEELQELKYPLVSHLWEHRKEPSEVRIFTTSGNYVDNIFPGYHKFPESIVRFIETSGRYDVVLDSLNIGFFGGYRFDAEKVTIYIILLFIQNISLCLID